ncbi:MAG: YybH family protein, partial [Actinomycetota bacterium]
DPNLQEGACFQHALGVLQYWGKVKRMRLSLAVFIICILSPIPVSGQTKVSGDDAKTKAVLRAAEAFVEAFSNLDWEPFRATFADDATMFFPFPWGLLSRASGKGEIEAQFKPAFGEDKKQGRVPPYLDIEPKDMKIQMAGDVAIMTFHLPGKGHMARRTIVWQKRGGRWLIVHLHASFIELPKAAAGQGGVP